jgi:hypothetical protein
MAAAGSESIFALKNTGIVGLVAAQAGTGPRAPVGPARIRKVHTVSLFRVKFVRNRDGIIMGDSGSNRDWGRFSKRTHWFIHSNPSHWCGYSGAVAQRNYC